MSTSSWVQPRLAGHGPTVFAGLSKYVDLKLVSRLEFASGAMQYEPKWSNAATRHALAELLRQARR